MENEIKKYHFPLLAAIPIVWIVVLFLGGSMQGIPLEGPGLVITKMHIGVFFTFVLGAKGFMYYSTRSYPLSPFMCWFDIALTIGLTAILVHFAIFNYFENGLSTDAAALLSLGVGTWMLMQFLMGLNYFLIMFSKMGNGKKLF